MSDSIVQTAEAKDESSEWVHEELKKLKKEGEFTSAVSRIRKVPQLLLRSENNRRIYFKPKILFLGPFHRKLESKESKQLKMKAAKLFMNARNNADVKKWMEAYKELRGNVNQYMKLYALETKDSQKSSEENNAWMFFLDGCAAMYFICGANDAAESGIKTHELVFAQQDLLMLENQLPMDVLKLLIKWNTDYEENKSWLDDFVKLHILTPTIGDVTRNDKDHSIHLLHLMRIRQRQGAASSNENRNFDPATIHSSLPYSCRSAVQLHKSGISFRAIQTCCKEKVHFRDRLLSGVLYLPSIIIDDLSKGKLLNLLADEMSSDVPNASEIASYLCFLDSLIDDAEDVKILRDANIIINGLGSDKKLVKLFNEITENLVPDNEIYKGVSAAIQTHFHNKTKTWTAQLYDDYFGTPWALIAFSAATLVITLNLIQTYLSFVPPASKERSQWKMFGRIVKHVYMPIVLALPMTCLLLVILLVPLVGIYMYGFPSKYKLRN